jgi:hypothetical protein
MMWSWCCVHQQMPTKCMSAGCSTEVRMAVRRFLSWQLSASSCDSNSTLPRASMLNLTRCMIQERPALIDRQHVHLQAVHDYSCVTNSGTMLACFIRSEARAFPREVDASS